MTVHITFDPPARADSGPSNRSHRRNLKGVPPGMARQMRRDFAAYQRDPTEEKRQKLYTYSREDSRLSGGEALVALDFDEVLTLEAVELEPASSR